MPGGDRTIEAILVDPMVRAVMKADRVDVGEMKRLLLEVRTRLPGRRDASMSAADGQRSPVLASDDDGPPHRRPATIPTAYEFLAACGDRSICEQLRSW